MTHKFKELTQEEVEKISRKHPKIHNLFKTYYQCSECGIVAYRERDRVGISLLSGLELRFVGKSPEIISCDEFIIREIIE